MQTFTFAENKYFSDKELSKTFEVSTEAPKLDKFSLNVDLKTTPVAIKWKSDAVNLVKLKPRPKAVEQEEFDEFEDAGSFFNLCARQIRLSSAPMLTSKAQLRRLGRQDEHRRSPY